MCSHWAWTTDTILPNQKKCKERRFWLQLIVWTDRHISCRADFLVVSGGSPVAYHPQEQWFVPGKSCIIMLNQSRFMLPPNSHNVAVSIQGDAPQQSKNAKVGQWNCQTWLVRYWYSIWYTNIAALSTVVTPALCDLVPTRARRIAFVGNYCIRVRNICASLFLLRRWPVDISLSPPAPSLGRRVYCWRAWSRTAGLPRNNTMDPSGQPQHCLNANHCWPIILGHHGWLPGWLQFGPSKTFTWAALCSRLEPTLSSPSFVLAPAEAHVILEDFGGFWMPGTSWYILVHLSPSWSILVHLGLSWHILDHLGT